jgi:hypothetical protein
MADKIYHDHENTCGHRELIEAIQRWSEAYPVEVFPEPPPGEHGVSVDACSAAMGRHIIGRLMELISVDAALGIGDTE